MKRRCGFVSIRSVEQMQETKLLWCKSSSTHNHQVFCVSAIVIRISPPVLKPSSVCLVDLKNLFLSNLAVYYSDRRHQQT